MAHQLPLEGRFHFVTGLDPVADFDAGTVSSDVINASQAKAVHFIVHQGVGATGTRTYTVEACDDVVPTTTTAIPFYYSESLATGTSDVFGAVPLRVAAAGKLTTLGSGQIHVISVDVDQLAATSQRKYVRLKMVEGTDSPVLAGILVAIEHQTPRGLHTTAIT